MRRETEWPRFPRRQRRGIGGIAAALVMCLLAIFLLAGCDAALASQAPDTPINGDPTATTDTGEPLPTTTATGTTATPRRTPTAAGGAPTGAGTTTRNGCQITSDSITGEQHLLALLNAHRAAAGAPTLALSATLSRASREHSCDMFLHNTLNHTGSDGSSPFDRIRAAGLTYIAAGENIANAHNYALIEGIDVDDSDMMAEPLTQGNHHWNIVYGGYTQVGLGVIYANGWMYFTEDFIG